MNWLRLRRWIGDHPVEDVFFEDPNGNSIHGWYMENSTTGSADDPWLNILYLHGGGYNLAVNYRLERYSFLLSLGRVRLFAFEYAGYGKSEGQAKEDQILRSAEGALHWFEEKLNVSDARNITLLGRSLGTSVASWLPAEVDSAEEVRRMVLFAGFAEVASGAADMFPLVGWAVKEAFPDQFQSTKYLPKYGKPWLDSGSPSCLLQVHSRDDDWVSMRQARTLFRSATGVPDSCKTFVEFSGSLHTDFMWPAEKESTRTWLNEHREQ